MSTKQGRVVVLGMHRSGTSAVTRIINLLGLPLCQDDDLYTSWDNPAGHWESRSLIQFNDRLLELSGGAWNRPPRLRPSWETQTTIARYRAGAMSIFAAAYPTTEWVWKDPRTCLTLPFWRPMIDPTAIVLVLRNPVAVAASIRRRDRLGTALAAGLWERYTQSALQSAGGLPVVVVRYEEIAADPASSVAGLLASFAALDIHLGGDQAAAAASISSQPRAGTVTKARLTPAQKRLVAITDRLPAVSRAFVTPPLPRETWWLQQVFTGVARRLV